MPPARAAAPAAARSGGPLHLPVTVFAITMGLSGVALAWQRAAGVFGMSPVLGLILAWTALGVFGFLGIAYAAKAIRHPAAVRGEWRHPVMLPFTATIPVSALILAAATVDASRPVSAVLWWSGALVQLVLTLGVLRVWIADARLEPGHMHPAWFIPVVGNLVVPVAGTEHAPTEMSWFFFAVGLGFWLALLPVILNRLFLHGPLAPNLAPTLAILVAPPAVAYLSWLRLGGTATDPAARILLHLATFQALLLIVQAGALRKLPFTLSVWAYTFPLASLTSAFLAAARSGIAGYRPAAAFGLGVVSLLTADVVGRTLLAARRGVFRRAESPAAG